MKPITSVLRLLPLGCFFLAASCNDLVGSGKLSEALIDTFLDIGPIQVGGHRLSHSPPFMLVRFATGQTH
jgi:hypothetical protein